MDFRDGWEALVHVSLPWMGCESLVFLGSRLWAEHQAGRHLHLCSRLVTGCQGELSSSCQVRDEKAEPWQVRPQPQRLGDAEI